MSATRVPVEEGAVPTRNPSARRWPWRGAASVASLLVAAACGNDEVVLPGERLSIEEAAPGFALAPLSVPNTAFAAPAPLANGAWTHTNGTPSHSIRHPALSPNPVPVWSASAGAGDSRGNRITASPVSAAGVVFTLDSRAGVAAVDARTGGVIWRTDVSTPSDPSSDASGGGLALAAGTLYVTSGFGTLTALEAGTGRTRWTQDLDAAATGAPTVDGDLVYAVSRDGLGWAVETGNGRVRWQVDGIGDAAGVTGPAGPAVSGRAVFFPFGAGDIVAALREGGTRLWSAAVTGARDGRAYFELDDITGAVVADGDRLYAGNATGRIVALDAATGQRIWTAREGAVGPVWPSGGSVFAVTDAGAAIRMDAATGAVMWSSPLPTFTAQRERRRKGVVAHYGPVLAGGRLWIASSDGVLRGLDPSTGTLASQVTLPAGAASAPIVVNRVMYLMDERGNLNALR